MNHFAHICDRLYDGMYDRYVQFCVPRHDIELS